MKDEHRGFVMSGVGGAEAGSGRSRTLVAKFGL